MGTKTKSFLSALALGFGLLAFAPATSEAGERHFTRHHDRHRPHYRQHRPRHHFRPNHGRSYYRHHRPYRLVRVLIHDPFPRFVYRRVYFIAPGAPYSPY